MTEIYWNKDLLPEEYRDVKMEDLYFIELVWGVNNFRRQGAVLGEIYRYDKETKLFSDKVEVVSPVSGFVKYSDPSFDFNHRYQYPLNSAFCTIYPQEEIECEYDAYYQIFTDPFSKEKRIKWISLFDSTYIKNGLYWFDFTLGVSFSYDGNPHLLLSTRKSCFKPKIKC